MIKPQNKNVCQLIWHLWYVHTIVEVSELYCYNREGNRNSVVRFSRVFLSCKANVRRSPRIITLSPLSLATDVTDVTLGVSDL